jgi:hypothetical protein
MEVGVEGSAAGSAAADLPLKSCGRALLLACVGLHASVGLQARQVPHQAAHSPPAPSPVPAHLLVHGQHALLQRLHGGLEQRRDRLHGRRLHRLHARAQRLRGAGGQPRQQASQRAVHLLQLGAQRDVAHLRTCAQGRGGGRGRGGERAAGARRGASGRRSGRCCCQAGSRQVRAACLGPSAGHRCQRRQARARASGPGSAPARVWPPCPAT